MANAKSFQHPQQLLGSTGIAAITAFNCGAGVEGVAAVKQCDLVKRLASGDPVKLGEAWDDLITSAEWLAKWSAALMESAYKVQGMDEFDWSAVVDADDMVRRYRIMQRIAESVNSYIA